MEAHPRAAPVLHPADRLEASLRVAAGKGLAVEGLVAGDLHLQHVRERVDDGDADAVQAAGGLVDLRIELTARVQRGHDDLERRLARKFRVRIDRDAAAVVGDDEGARLLQLHLDEARVARDRLVHGIVDHLGEEVVQRPLVGAADIHAGPAPHRLQPLQHLDRRGVVTRFRRLRRGRRLRCHGGETAAALGLRGGRLASWSEQVACRIAHATAPRIGSETGCMALHTLVVAEQKGNKKPPVRFRRSHYHGDRGCSKSDRCGAAEALSSQ
ncbi:hypothetical protein CHKEEEPN_3238 [Methylorubrum podarium]|nr:hypothetical protein CHKEEEPN_3238 [Methylorubrum podarium]